MIDMKKEFGMTIHRILSWVGVGVLATSMVLGSVLPAQAASTQGSLTITPKVGDSIVSESYDGTFALYQIATGVDYGDYDITDEFKDYDGTAITKEYLEDETAFKTIAQDLALYLEQQANGGNAVTPHLDGIKAFTAYDLPYGLYLVTQRDAGSKYNACTPILVQIPAYSIDADGTRHTTYNVKAYPKLTKPGDKHDPPTPTPPTHYGKVVLGKSDAATGKALQGVVFNLYKQDKDGNWNVIGTYMTDEQGIVYVDHLSYGDYYFEEAAALDGYVLDDTPQEFKINSEDTVQLVMTNSPIPQVPEVPEGEDIGGYTGDSSHMMLYGVIVVIAAGGLVYWVARRRKEEQ